MGGKEGGDGESEGGSGRGARGAGEREELCRGGRVSVDGDDDDGDDDGWIAA